MKRKIGTIYAVCCTIALLAGIVLVFLFAWQAGIPQTAACLCGLALGFVLSPIVHELGHITMGKAANMRLVYCKAFCFQYRIKKGKGGLAFASPFAPEQTQMLPRSGGDMQRRAIAYTLGGLLFSGAFFAGILLLALLADNLVAWGILPYAGYLFLLNVAPVEYAGGKTDSLVYFGLKKGGDEERCMLAAMEIQGELSAGRRFGEIDKSKYFDMPQLPEDAPLYAVTLDLRYRYCLDEGDREGAADCLNRMVGAQAYLSDGEVEKLAAELTYMHAVGGDIVRAQESAKLCEEFLKTETLLAKRALAAYTYAVGNVEAGEKLIEQAKELLPFEFPAGVRKLEEKLLLEILAA